MTKTHRCAIDAINKPWVLAPLIVTALSCAGLQSRPAGASACACQKISGLPGSEDFAVLPHGDGSALLIVSSQDRRHSDQNGWLSALPVNAPGQLGAARRLLFRNRDKRPFHPHGLSIWRRADGSVRVFAINHLGNGEQAIEIFELRGDTLVFRRRLQNPLLRSPNDLIAAGDDELYVSNDRGWPDSLMAVEALLRLPLGNVVHYRHGRWRVVVDGVAFANGLELSPGGEHLYIAALRENRIRQHARDPKNGDIGALQRSFDLGSGVDNLLWSQQGELVTAAHPDLLAFSRHAADPAQAAPSQVFAIDVGSGEVRTLLLDDGARVQAASVAWPAGERVILGQVFADGVLACPTQTGR